MITEIVEIPTQTFMDVYSNVCPREIGFCTTVDTFSPWRCTKYKALYGAYVGDVYE